jgi:hypothetical protein
MDTCANESTAARRAFWHGAGRARAFWHGARPRPCGFLNASISYF